MNISEMLARNARMYPTDTALVERIPEKGVRKEITWEVFNTRVNRIANALLDRGVKQGDRVIHWMMNSITWLEAYLGIARTGAWAVPLNFRFGPREFSYCMSIAEPSAMIMDERFEEITREVEADNIPATNVIVADRSDPGADDWLETIISGSAEDPVDPGIRDEEPCGLYFTSGTTGDPKPILLSHKNMECMAITEVVHGLRRQGDTFMILKPLYHTGDMIHWLASLILGGPAVIQKSKITPRVIFESMDEEQGTVAMLLVPWIQDILSEMKVGELDREDYDLSAWRLLLLGAQPVPPVLVRRWTEIFPQMEFEVNYGLTEACGPGCIHLGIGNDHKLGSIGRPGFNWEACIMDGNGYPVSTGETGEIVVKGNGVMIEYYRNPEKTAETIKGGWLLTGDMGRTDNDGFFWLVDRKKDMIIYGGENIYPVEIEEVLTSHPSVHDVGVFGIPDERLGEVVAAVIELEPGAEASARDNIRSYCEEKLPRYKQPRTIIFDKVIRNPTGKILKYEMKRLYFNI